MNMWLRGSVLILMIAAAVVCYVASFSGGAMLFMLLGVLFELAFWVGLLKTMDHKS